MSQIKPGPNSTGFVLIPPNTGGGGIAVQITALTAPGTPSGLCTVQELNPSGILATALHTSVSILPFPQFAEVGDKGIMVTYTPTSGLIPDVKYVQLSKSAFLKFV